MYTTFLKSLTKYISWFEFSLMRIYNDIYTLTIISDKKATPQMVKIWHNSGFRSLITYIGELC